MSRTFVLLLAPMMMEGVEGELDQRGDPLMGDLAATSHTVSVLSQLTRFVLPSSPHAASMSPQYAADTMVDRYHQVAVYGGVTMPVLAALRTLGALSRLHEQGVLQLLPLRIADAWFTHPNPQT
ncbi:hypothetical protein BDN70DRAFT_940149 [Pholiota conissans]|uniref:Uncharacterized protein n=1 Tax=Pholiota conissans TaxID=109636 RepID=A0A9P5YHK4_9AGAR|nr:hypothetical protein BDN70DRAFT_940149 [Pholiota conissans]